MIWGSAFILDILYDIVSFIWIKSVTCMSRHDTIWDCNLATQPVSETFIVPCRSVVWELADQPVSRSEWSPGQDYS
jgi:hypothetical protein